MNVMVDRRGNTVSFLMIFSQIYQTHSDKRNIICFFPIPFSNLKAPTLACMFDFVVFMLSLEFLAEIAFITAFEDLCQGKLLY